MKVYISVVSHGHGCEIKDINVLSDLNKHFNVVVKSNLNDPVLVDYCSSSEIELIDSHYGLGFGHNNNVVYQYCIDKLGMTDSDLFIVLNPDVLISKDKIELLCERMSEHGVKISTIDLYTDINYTTHDNNIRLFPSFFDFVQSFVGLGNKTILNKDLLLNSQIEGWAAGSFLAFNSGHYRLLSGFDEKYFMYCEDIDICYRSYVKEENLMFYKDIKAVHFAKHGNRRIFSKHFIWHVKSVLRFLLSKLGLSRASSSL